MNDGHLLVVKAAAAVETYADDLAGCGFVTREARSLGEAVRQVVADPPRSILATVDASSALQVCEVLCAVSPFPLLIAGRGLPVAIAASCLDEGADAVVSLPIAVTELAARIRGVQRRAAVQPAAAPASRLRVGELVVDTAARAVWWRGEPVELSPTEFRLLTVLAENAGCVVTNRELLSRVWGKEYVDDLHYVRLYVGYLRAKLEDDPARPRLILNQWGVGYRLAVEEPPRSEAAP